MPENYDWCQLLGFATIFWVCEAWLFRHRGSFSRLDIGVAACNHTYRPLVFLVCQIGIDKLEIHGKLRVFLTSLSSTLPGTDVVIGVSPLTEVPQRFGSEFNLSVGIAYVNSTVKPADLSNWSSWDVWLFFCLLRSVFYRDYLHRHREIEYVFYCDCDTMILRDPMELTKDDPEVVHIMYDKWPVNKTNDMNFRWIRTCQRLPERAKRKCGLRPWKHKLFDPEIGSQIPYNAGLMFGKVGNVLKIISLVARKFECLGHIHNLADQGILNYLRFSGQLNDTGVKMRAYHVNEELVSCPEFFDKDQASQVWPKVVALHHWNYIPRDVLQVMGPGILALAASR